MRFIKYYCAVVVLFTACRAARTAMSDVATSDIQPTIAVAVSGGSNTISFPAASAPQSATVIEASLADTAEATAANALSAGSIAVASNRQHITSFTQMKEMARSGAIRISKKDMRTLNRLEKHYKGNYEQFRADAFELTDKAKIIGGIGVLGLLIGIIFGSAFGWFLFVVAALAFLLRYLNIIMF